MLILLKILILHKFLDKKGVKMGKRVPNKRVSYCTMENNINEKEAYRYDKMRISLVLILFLLILSAIPVNAIWPFTEKKTNYILIKRDVNDINFDGNIIGGFDGNLYFYGWVNDWNGFEKDLNGNTHNIFDWWDVNVLHNVWAANDINGLRLCINGHCIDSWADVNTYVSGGGITDTNVWMANWLDDYNALVNDLNGGGNSLFNFKDGNFFGDVNAFGFCFDENCVHNWHDLNQYIWRTFAAHVGWIDAYPYPSTGIHSIDDFENNWNFWVNSDDAQAAIQEAVIVKEGANSVKLRIDASLSASDDARWTNTDNFGDLSQYTGVASGRPRQGKLSIWIRCDATDPLRDSVELELSLGSGAANYGRFDIPAGVLVRNTWVQLNLYLPSILIIGNPNWTAVDYAVIRFNEKKNNETDFSCYADAFNIENQFQTDTLTFIGGRGISSYILGDEVTFAFNSIEINDTIWGNDPAGGDGSTWEFNTTGGEDVNLHFGDDDLNIDGNVGITHGRALRFHDDYFYVAFRSLPLASSTIYTWPTYYGSAGQVLTTTADGNLYWSSVSGGASITDTNAWESGGGYVLQDDTNRVLIDWIPNEDAEGSIPTGLDLGNDANRWEEGWIMSRDTGMLDEGDYLLPVLQSFRRCNQCVLGMAPDINTVREYKTTGLTMLIDDNEWIQSFDVNLAADEQGTLIIWEGSAFHQDINVIVGGAGSGARDLIMADKWFETKSLHYDGQTSNEFRQGISYTGVSYDKYNGLAPVAIAGPMGCDTISITFDEPLPADFSYSIEFTGYNQTIEWEFPEPAIGELHTDAVITAKTNAGFTGQVNYKVYDIFGRIIMNPITGLSGNWCNYTTLSMDLAVAGAGIPNPIDWQVTVYQT